MKKNIILVGVGGQGTILAAKVLSQVALNMKMDVKMSEIHGMAQRGGSVVTQIKIDEKTSICLRKKFTSQKRKIGTYQ